jgi:hypothetical protein
MVTLTLSRVTLALFSIAIVWCAVCEWKASDHREAWNRRWWLSYAAVIVTGILAIIFGRRGP